MIEDDAAVGPTVMVDQTQVRKESHTNSFQTSLVTQREAVALDLHRERWGGEPGCNKESQQTPESCDTLRCSYNSKNVCDFIQRMLCASTRPVLQEHVDISVDAL